MVMARSLFPNPAGYVGQRVFIAVGIAAVATPIHHQKITLGLQRQQRMVPGATRVVDALARCDPEAAQPGGALGAAA